MNDSKKFLYAGLVYFAIYMASVLVAHADFCVQQLYECTTMSCFDCRIGADGNKYCSNSGNNESCNKCDGGDWLCYKEDGSTYTKPYMDKGAAPAVKN